MLPDDLPTDIDISQLGRRDHPDASDYAIILHHNELHAPNLESLEMVNHNLTGR